MRYEYEDRGAEVCCGQIIEFEDDRIILDIPEEGVSVEQWKIVPLTYPGVSLITMS